MTRYIIIVLCFLIIEAEAQSIRRLDNSTIDNKKLTLDISKLLDTARVAGMVVAVFNDGKPVYSHAFGYSNANTKQKLRTSTEFYGASLSKAVFACLVMKLVEEG